VSKQKKGRDTLSEEREEVTPLLFSRRVLPLKKPEVIDEERAAVQLQKLQIDNPRNKINFSEVFHGRQNSNTRKRDGEGHLPHHQDRAEILQEPERQGQICEEGKVNPMDEEKVIAALNEGFAGVGTKLEAQLAAFNESARGLLGSRTTDPTEIDKATDKVIDKADMEQLTGITNLEVWDIPVGAAVVGGFVAVMASELIDGFLMNQGGTTKGLVKLVAAGASVKYGKRWLGSTGSKAVAILLAYDGIRMLLPLDEWANRGATALSGVMPGAGLAKNAGQDITPNPGGGGRGAVDYYAKALGG